MSIYRRRSSGKRSRFLTAEFQYLGKPYRRGGFMDRESARHWLMTEQLRLRRGAVGYTKAMTKALVAPLIDDFVERLRTKGCDDQYVYIAEKRLQKLAAECGWKTLGDITADSMEKWLAEPHKFHKKLIGAKAKNQHAQIAGSFGKWLVKPKHLLPSNPLEDVALLRVTGNPGYRRAASVEEINKLLATCPAERRLFYMFLLYVPLRMRTMRRLTWRMLHLNATPPWISIPAELNKSRRVEKSPMRYDLAAELRKAKGKGDDLVFPWLRRKLGPFKDDLTVAGISFDDGKGSRRLDRHAFRKTMIRLLKMAGVSVDAASLILHHRDVRTTRRHYDDDMVDPVITDVLEKLPAVGKVRSA
jgi:integrase